MTKLDPQLLEKATISTEYGEMTNTHLSFDDLELIG